MSADIISLSQARKAKEKTKAAKGAAGNRLKFGRTKAQKALDQLEQERKVRTLDFAKRDASSESVGEAKSDE
jgi:hypothetical protein